MTQTEIQITSSIRYDTSLLRCEPNNVYSEAKGNPSTLYMFIYHKDRMQAAAEEFSRLDASQKLVGAEGATNLTKAILDHLIEKYESTEPRDPVRIRITVSTSGTISITSFPTPPVALSTLFPTVLSPSPNPSTLIWQIRLAPNPISPSLYTKHKTTKRAHYDSARAHLGDGSAYTELLLQNPSGEIMEGTITTPYFLRGGSWVTPRWESGGNQGTTRRWALEQGLATEGIVKVEDLVDQEIVWLSNGVRGFGWGQLDLR